MKFRRSERLIDMTTYLLEHPRQLVPLTYFADKYGSAKSRSVKISESSKKHLNSGESVSFRLCLALPGESSSMSRSVKKRPGR